MARFTEPKNFTDRENIILAVLTSCSRKNDSAKTETFSKTEEKVATCEQTREENKTTEEKITEEENTEKVESKEIIIADVQGEIPEDHVHSFLFYEKREPTCSAEGYTSEKCSCGAILKKTIKKLNHRKSNATCINPSVCLDCGVYISPALGHTTETGVCSRCGLDFSKSGRAMGLCFCYWGY